VKRDVGKRGTYERAHMTYARVCASSGKCEARGKRTYIHSSAPSDRAGVTMEKMPNAPGVGVVEGCWSFVNVAGKCVVLVYCLSHRAQLGNRNGRDHREMGCVERERSMHG
jgi:hypothetical protein